MKKENILKIKWVSIFLIIAVLNSILISFIELYFGFEDFIGDLYCLVFGMFLGFFCYVKYDEEKDF